MRSLASTTGAYGLVEGARDEEIFTHSSGGWRDPCIVGAAQGCNRHGSLTARESQLGRTDHLGALRGPGELARSAPLSGDGALRTDFSRVVYDNQPYLVVRREDGSLDRAYGPFTPGTEPNLGDCTDEKRVTSQSLLASLEDLLPISPELPSNEDTLAGG